MPSASPTVAPSATPAGPLVSVLVRSVDRPLLDEALASIALQTWPNIEVVVVAARPGHRELPPRCGAFELRLVPTDAPLHRSAAANRALDHARGDCLLFLDDDDWLMPGHVARLADVLQRQPHAHAAYTGVALANGKGEPLGQVMDLPFDGVRQLAGNITPIHAVLFHRALCQGVNPARFDEQLDHYEDWDFWLQIARRSTFVHLPGVSAFYRIHDSSGVHLDSGPLSAAAAHVFDRWQGRWTPAQRGRLLERSWATDDLQRELDGARTAIDDLKRVTDAQHAALARQSETLARQSEILAQQETTIARQQGSIDHQVATLHEQAWQASRLLAQSEEQSAALASRDEQVAQLLESTSWKITAPLRRLADAIKRR